MAATVSRGIAYDIHAWPAPLAVEKLLKGSKNTARYCPSCCASKGKIARPLPVAPAFIQLELALEEALPAIAIAPRMDWLEMTMMRDWRSIRLPAPAGIDQDLL